MARQQGEQKCVGSSQQLEKGRDASECQSFQDEEVMLPQGPLLAIRALCFFFF